MNNQQKLLILTAVVGVSAIGLLIILNRRRSNNDDIIFEQDGEQPEMEFADLGADDAVASASETVVRVKVPRYAVGAIIGKGGQNIRQLKKDTGARLDFEREDDSKEKNESNERILEIRGNRERVRDAEIKIRQLIAEQPPIITFELSVPQEACGRIIGRGGQTIREICQISGARVTVERTEDRSKKGMRTVTINGNVKQVEYAKGLVQEKVEAEKIISSKYGKFKQQAKQQPSPTRTKVKHQSKRLPDTDDYFEVFVSAFDLPSHIYIQVVTPESQRLDQLTQDMTEYYSNLENTDNKQLVNGVHVGEIYCAPFNYDELWYRACVMEINSTERIVDLYYIDFGDTGKVSLDDLRIPKPEFLELESQAIECCLSGIEPKDGQWSDDAIKRFDELSQCAQWSVLIARKVGYVDTANGRITCLELIDTKHDEDINLAETMIKEGFAISAKTESSEASNDRIISGSEQTSNNNAVGNNKDLSKLPEMTSENEDLQTREKAVVDEELINQQEVMQVNEDIQEQEAVEESQAIQTQEVFQVPEVMSEEIVVPDMTQNVPISNQEGDLTVKIIDEIPALEDIDAELNSNLIGKDDSKRLSADAWSLSSTSTEDTVIQLMSASKITDVDKPHNHAESHIDDAAVSQTMEDGSNTERSVESEKPELKVQRSASEGQSANQGERSSQEQRSNIEQKSNAKVANVEDGRVKVSAQKLKIDDEVNKWIEKSTLERDPEAALKSDNEANHDEHNDIDTKTAMEFNNATTQPARMIFQNSLELSKENPIMLSDDEDSLSYMSARSELTIADTDTMSYRSAPDTPTNVESFDFPRQRDSSLDYDIITTPVGSDDESISTPAAFNSANIEPATPVNVRTPSYQIRIVDETPKINGGSSDALSTANQETGKLSSSPQRISNLSASTPQFGNLKTSQSRFGGSGSMIGKETSI